MKKYSIRTCLISFQEHDLIFFSTEKIYVCVFDPFVAWQLCGGLSPSYGAAALAAFFSFCDREIPMSHLR